MNHKHTVRHQMHLERPSKNQRPTAKEVCVFQRRLVAGLCANNAIHRWRKRCLHISADIIQGVGYSDDVHHTGKHYLLHWPHRSTIDASTISNCTYNRAGRNLQPSAQYCNDVSGKLIGTQALLPIHADVPIAELSQTLH